MLCPSRGLLRDCTTSCGTDGSFYGTKQELSLGFTFSFPLVQESLVAARLVSWTKSFNCPGVEGEEVVGLLQAAIDRRGLKVE